MQAVFLRALLAVFVLNTGTSMVETTNLSSLPDSSSGARVFYGDSEVRVDGLTPGTRVVWFALGLERVANAWSSVVRQRGEEVDNDLDGSLTFESPQKIPRSSVWAFVDVDGEQVYASSPSGARFRLVEADRTRFRKGARRLLLQGTSWDVLWFRKQQGIWQLTSKDGGPGDRDGVGNRRMDISADDFVARFPEGRDPPRSLEAGDIVLAVNRDSLGVTLVEITP